jgi:hypothetical protein
LAGAGDLELFDMLRDELASTREVDGVAIVVLARPSRRHGSWLVADAVGMRQREHAQPERRRDQNSLECAHLYHLRSKGFIFSLVT